MPRYNVWSLGDTTENVDTQYTDGGSLDDTGILGLLAQTEEGGNNRLLRYYLSTIPAHHWRKRAITLFQPQYWHLCSALILMKKPENMHLTLRLNRIPLMQNSMR